MTVDLGMTLREKQSLFVELVGKLIARAYATGYEMTFGETYRTPEQAAANAKAGKGIARSLHCVRLAADFNLFRDGVWLRDTEDFADLGAFWERLHPDCRWGGRFNDGNHFSLTHDGRA